MPFLTTGFEMSERQPSIPAEIDVEIASDVSSSSPLHIAEHRIRIDAETQTAKSVDEDLNAHTSEMSCFPQRGKKGRKDETNRNGMLLRASAFCRRH